MQSSVVLIVRHNVGPRVAWLLRIAAVVDLFVFVVGVALVLLDGCAGAGILEAS